MESWRSLSALLVWMESVPPLWINVGLVGAWLGVILLIAEGLYRYRAADPEVMRKVVHIGSGNVILMAWWLQIPAWIGIAAGIIAAAIALLSYRFSILPGLNSVGRNSLGTFFYAVSIAVTIAWFWPLDLPQYAAIGILTMTWGDGFAAIIGQRFGRHGYQLWGMNKSWEGTLAMIAVSYVVSSSILFSVQGNCWETWLVSAAVALVAASLEAFSKLGLDNLTVPIGAATVGFILHQLY